MHTKQILTYKGVLTQDGISDMLETIEERLQDDTISRGKLAHISIIFIELCQNMINYSKDIIEGTQEVVPYGSIQMYKTVDFHYVLESRNILSINDQERVLKRLLDIDSLTKDAVKRRYKELRRSAKHAHSKGAGIGLYDIAKRCEKINYHFEAINKDKLYFSLQITI